MTQPFYSSSRIFDYRKFFPRIGLYLNIPNMNRLLLILIWFFFGSFVNVADLHTYIGLDEYKNQLLDLQLNPDNTFTYRESFLDGSSLEDHGKWEIKGDKLILQSNSKSRREHQYLKFDKSFKFNGDAFAVREDSLKYLPNPKRKLNQYLSSYILIKSMRKK